MVGPRPPPPSRIPGSGTGRAGYRPAPRSPLDTALALVWSSTQHEERCWDTGENGSDDYNDTWTYDGTTWTRIALSTLPPGRVRFGMAYDPHIDATVLYGGRKNYPDPTPRDTWHFSNGVWSLQPSVGAPTTNDDFPLA